MRIGTGIAIAGCALALAAVAIWAPSEIIKVIAWSTVSIFFIIVTGV